MKQFGNILSILIIIIVIGIYGIVFFWRDINLIEHFGFDKTEMSNEDIKDIIIRISLLAIFTLLGILCKVLYDQIEQADEDSFSILKVIRKTANSKQAWLAIVISPIIIVSFYKSIQDIDNYPLVALLAFQNGFFFKSILNKKKDEL